ncbi:Hypothetical predicted protein [Paramuricea clavata]|uniref:Uncharacterized protein n=1 Tax=Paramuricea clavata TaxID=317549 RepID=A0A7D9L1N3_PARCT|nr:Hypothetical predicted protein [Paramuricea clavata]
MFEEDEGATGWKAGESVGYCNNCQLTYSPTTVNSDVVESLDEERERLTPSPLPETNRDSCQPEMAVEPSCTSSTSTCNTSSNSLNDPEEDDRPDSENGEKTFVPLKKKKLSAKDHVGEAVELLKTMVQNDPSKELMRFMQDEAEK